MGHVGVVVDDRGMALPPRAPGMRQAIALAHRGRDEGEGLLRKPQPIGAGEDARGMSERGNHQPVPVGQHLVVEAGANTRRAGVEEDGARAREPGLGRSIGERRVLQAVEDGMAFPIAAGRHVVEWPEVRRTLAEEGIDLRLAPDIELPFLMLTVGIEARGEAALGAAHLARHPADGLGDPLRIELALLVLPDQGQEIDELGIVVEHLLEMRHQPACIDGVARVAAAEMVVDAALRDVRRGSGRRHRGGAPSPPLAGAPQQLEEPGLGKFRRIADTAMDGDRPRARGARRCGR